MRVFSGSFRVLHLRPGGNERHEIANAEGPGGVQHLATRRTDAEALSHFLHSVFGPQMGTAVNNVIYSITADNKPVAATLKAAADSIRQLQDEKGLK